MAQKTWNYIITRRRARVRIVHVFHKIYMYVIYTRVQMRIFTIIAEKLRAVITRSLSHLLALSFYHSLVKRSYLACHILHAQRRSRIMLRCKNQRRRRGSGLPVALGRPKRPRCRMRSIITIITANNNSLVGSSRSSCSDSRRSLRNPQRWVGGALPWGPRSNERVPPHYRGPVEGPVAARRSTGTRIVVVCSFLHPQSVVHQSHDWFLAFLDRSHKVDRAISASRASDVTATSYICDDETGIKSRNDSRFYANLNFGVAALIRNVSRLRSLCARPRIEMDPEEISPQ